MARRRPKPRSGVTIGCAERRRRGYGSITFSLLDEDNEKISRVAKRLDCTRSAVVVRGVEALLREQRAHAKDASLVREAHAKKKRKPRVELRPSGVTAMPKAKAISFRRTSPPARRTGASSTTGRTTKPNVTSVPVPHVEPVAKRGTSLLEQLDGADMIRKAFEGYTGLSKKE